MEEDILPGGFEWCRKSKYEVQAELACYPITDQTPLLEGFEEKEFEINNQIYLYAVKSGYNILEQNSWTTSPEKPFILTGTAGEKWVVKYSNLEAYDIDINLIGLTPITIQTKDPEDQEFLVAYHVPLNLEEEIVPKWAFDEFGNIDETQIITANSPISQINHDNGDYVIAKHTSGQPEYMQLPPEIRKTKEIAEIYQPRIINGIIMQATYDHALTKEEIKDKYGFDSI